MPGERSLVGAEYPKSYPPLLPVTVSVTLPVCPGQTTSGDGVTVNVKGNGSVMVIIVSKPQPASSLTPTV